MKKNARGFFMGLLVFLTGMAALPAVNFAEEAAGTYYTKFNIWYEKPEKIMSTNYHKGLIIPVGSEVEIRKRNRKEIRFYEKRSGTEFRIKLHDKYTPLDEAQFFDRYFSKENVLDSAKYKSFTDMEKENIGAGTLHEGMSKDAVLMAYGYPPTHRTPSTNGDAWTYWRSRVVYFMIQFKDGKLDRIMG